MNEMFWDQNQLLQNCRAAVTLMSGSQALHAVEIYCPTLSVGLDFRSNWPEPEFSIVCKPIGIEFKTLPTQC
jgi:hypothetical protein